MRHHLLASALFGFTLLTGCKGSPSAAAPPLTSADAQAVSPAQQQPKTSPEALSDVTAGDRDFAAKLYDQLRAKPGNLFFSPASIRLALGMTYAGAAGETKSQMAKVLDLGPAPHNAFAALLADWNSRASVQPAGNDDWQKDQAERSQFTFRVVNRLWGEKTVPFHSDFLSLLQNSYAAPLEKLDFANAPDPSRLTINRWVEEKTETRIKDLIPAGMVTSATRMVLTNAVYFKATWTYPFSESQTKLESFFVRPNSPVQVPTMHLNEHLSYAPITVNGTAAKAISLSYEAPDLAMLVLVPDAKDGLPQLEQGLSASVIDSTFSKLQMQLVDLAMPKFKTTLAFQLGKTLSDMGMPLAFQAGRADFSPMDGSRDICIGDVVHKAFVAVDEKGTEAAAATAVIMKATAMIMATPIQVHLDHPFVYMILDTRHSSVLFMGRVVDPTAS